MSNALMHFSKKAPVQGLSGTGPFQRSFILVLSRDTYDEWIERFDDTINAWISEHAEIIEIVDRQMSTTLDPGSSYLLTVVLTYRPRQ